MTYTVIPSVKGQITLPPSLRKKYKISKSTPIKIDDGENGIMIIKVMHLVDFNEIQYFENEKEARLNFPKGIDPQLLIDKIENNNG